MNQLFLKYINPQIYQLVLKQFQSGVNDSFLNDINLVYLYYLKFGLTYNYDEKNYLITSYYAAFIQRKFICSK